ncbi:Venom carboxylesterase-6 [Armadillidium vulgare]|nr:Venom carboxylesterase-6 [Armadillidium vulgare]
MKNTSNSPPKVVTPKTTFYGKVMNTTRRGQKYYAFTGIPYARSPIGHLRFMPPEPNDDMPPVFEATKNSPECIQWDNLLGRGVVGTEDCLYLNIYSNRIPEPPLYYNTQPIVVFLHAGTWSAGGGSSEIFNPDYLLESSIMVITINHRLGPFGFLTTETEEAQGNYGLLDQIAALEWIRDNSRYFGGMNDTVTIMGSGAGVLFHRAISLSGTAYSPHAIIRDPNENTKKLAQKLSCKTTTSNSLISCLKTLPANKITEVIPSLYEWDEEPILFGPVIDKKWMGKNAVIPDEPHHMIKHYEMLQVPWMVGTNKNDGAFRVQDILKDPALVNQLNTNWDKYGPLLLHLTKYSCKDPVQIANRIKDFYMGKSHFGEYSIHKFIEMITDRFFLYPTEMASQEHSFYLRKYKQFVYRYILTYCGKKSFLDIMNKVNPKEEVKSTLGMKSLNPRFSNKQNDAHGLGVSFMDELLFLFPSPKLEFAYDLNFFGEEAAKVASMMQILWSNFIKGGDPTPIIPGGPEDVSPWGTWWEPYVKGTLYYMQIDPEMATQDTPLKEKEMNFWKDLPLFENRDKNVIRDEL